MTVIKVIVFALYLGFLLRQGFGRRQAFASWHMFAGCRQCSFRLAYEDADTTTTRELNPWVYLPHTQLQMGRREAELFLLYLRRVEKLDDLQGAITRRDGFGLSELTVRDSRVVP